MSDRGRDVHGGGASTGSWSIGGLDCDSQPRASDFVVIARPKVAVIGAGAGGIAMGIALEEGGSRLHDLREVRRGGRHVARQHLSRGRLRRAVASLLLLVRATSSVIRSLGRSRNPTRDLSLPRTVHGPLPGARPHLRLGTAISSTHWNEATQRWELRASSGEQFSADVVVSGLGMLNVPRIPAIEGAERFHGRSFHSSQWDHSTPHAGEQGGVDRHRWASAIQYVPAIAPHVEQVFVFQRSPIWITPRVDKEYSPEEQRHFARFPLAARLHRFRDLAQNYQRGDPRADSEQTVMMTELARSYLAGAR